MQDFLKSRVSYQGNAIITEFLLSLHKEKDTDFVRIETKILIARICLYETKI